VKVKVGPISAQYKGTARFIEKDDAQHQAVLLAEGRDTRGQGNASATVTARAISDNDGTTVSIVTELSITGKVAQFGRSVMADVSAKMLGEFADRLEADVLSQGAGSEPNEPSKPNEPNQPDDPKTEAAGKSKTTVEEPVPSSVRTIHSAPAEPVDLLGTAGPSVLKRVVPLAIAAGLVLLFWRRKRRRRGPPD